MNKETRRREGHAKRTEYTYESAGITELEGNVPLWLWAVVVTLLVWGAYYLVTYWSAPIAPA